MKNVPVIGCEYGYYSVVSLDIKLSSDGKRMFDVVCSCGKREFKRACHLVSGRTKSCKSCAAKRTALTSPPPIVYKGVGDLSKTFFSSIEDGANKRGIPFNVTIEYLWDLYTSQGGMCALTGDKIYLHKHSHKSNPDWRVITASLDRIDNSQGYEVGNVWWVHKQANRLKNNYSMSELLYLCSKIVNTHGNPEPSSVKDITVTEKVQRLTGEESTNNPDTSAQPHCIVGEDIV